jgi:hypothetical protein
MKPMLRRVADGEPHKVDDPVAPLTSPALKSQQSTDLWTWARDLGQATFPAYQREQPALRAQPGAGRFFDDTPDINSFVNGSCAALLLMLGMGIDLLGNDPGAPLRDGTQPPNRALTTVFPKR